MENLFIKEIVNGKLIEIETYTVRHLFKIMTNKNFSNLSDYEKIAYQICSVLKINNEKVEVEDFLNSTDFEVCNFVAEAFNAMTKHNLI